MPTRPPNQPAPGEESSESFTATSLMRLAKFLLLICALQFIGLSYMIYQKKKAGPPPEQPVRSSVLSVSTKADKPREYSLKGKPGPWGELEYVRINIVSPDDFLPGSGQSIPKTRWHFGGYNADKLTAFFQSCDLTPEQLAELLRPIGWSVSAEGISITPSEQLVLGMSSEARGQIYSVLAETAANDFQVWPYTFRPGAFDEWFENSGVSVGQQALIKKLTYQRGPAMCFSDLRELLLQVPVESERLAITQALSRRTGLLVKLRVGPDSDVEKLTEYWSKGGRAKDVGALLDSLSKVPGGTTIDIAHLLPAFVRSRLNTFPAPVSNPNAHQPDCYWTAMNFYKNPPDPLYADDAIWRKDLADNYTQVEEPSFGDLLFMVRADGVPYHAAVYIADDIVFTKNGANHRQPWLLMRVEDMIARYPSNHPLSIVVFTPKHPAK